MNLHGSRSARIGPDTRVHPLFVRLSTIQLPAVLNTLLNVDSFRVQSFVLFIFLLISYIQRISILLRQHLRALRVADPPYHLTHTTAGYPRLPISIPAYLLP